ncbi:MAG: ATP-binding protein [Gammaproteobacteria bacterium]
MSRKDAPLWKRERLGLSMIAGSLLVIAVLCALLLQHLLSESEQRLRVQGVSLARVLSSIELQELAPASNPSSLLQTLAVSDQYSRFAYATLVSVDGSPIVEAAADGMLVPSWQPPEEPASWRGERHIDAQGNRPAIVEFYAPIMQGAERAAHLRLGYVAPSIGQSAANLPFYASLSLLVFLLTPLFYFLMRREIRPLKQAAADLRVAIDSDTGRPVHIQADGELGVFMHQFGQFVEHMNQRVADMQTERERVVTSTKLLSYRKERVLRVLESLPDAILVMDESGTITVVNRRLEEMLGVDVTTLSGSTSLEWCENDDVRQFLSQCRARASRRYLPEPVEVQLTPETRLTHTVTAYPLFSPSDSKSIGCLVVIRDTTLQALARNGRAEFVGHIAHELKTPLTVLSMYSETLQTADPDDRELRIEAANVIEDEVGRLSALINNLLSLTRIEMGSMDIDSQRVRVGDLLRDVFDAARHIRGADALRFDLELPDQLGVFSLDKDLLRIALNNLLSNAVKYNRPGGTVTMRAEETEECLRISVTDSGIGITAEDQSQVFEKFFRSDSDEVRDRSGHGLGLALTRDIVELHNGALSVSSEPGKGTRFVIELQTNLHTLAEVG